MTYLVEHYHIARKIGRDKLKAEKTNYVKAKDAARVADAKSALVGCECCGTVRREPEFIVINCTGGKQTHFIDRWYRSKCPNA